MKHKQINRHIDHTMENFPTDQIQLTATHYASANNYLKQQFYWI